MSHVNYTERRPICWLRTIPFLSFIRLRLVSRFPFERINRRVVPSFYAAALRCERKVNAKFDEQRTSLPLTKYLFETRLCRVPIYKPWILLSRLSYCLRVKLKHRLYFGRETRLYLRTYTRTQTLREKWKRKIRGEENAESKRNKETT